MSLARFGHRRGNFGLTPDFWEDSHPGSSSVLSLVRFGLAPLQEVFHRAELSHGSRESCLGIPGRAGDLPNPALKWGNLVKRTF